MEGDTDFPYRPLGGLSGMFITDIRNCELATTCCNDGIFFEKYLFFDNKKLIPYFIAHQSWKVATAQPGISASKKTTLTT